MRHFLFVICDFSMCYLPNRDSYFLQVTGDYKAVRLITHVITLHFGAGMCIALHKCFTVELLVPQG